MLLSKFCSKDIVNIENGEKLGKVRDVDIDLQTGKINYIVISMNQSISNMFKNNKKMNLEWKKIVNANGEVILIEK